MNKCNWKATNSRANTFAASRIRFRDSRNVCSVVYVIVQVSGLQWTFSSKRNIFFFFFFGFLGFSILFSSRIEIERERESERKKNRSQHSNPPTNLKYSIMILVSLWFQLSVCVCRWFNAQHTNHTQSYINCDWLIRLSLISLDKYWENYFWICIACMKTLAHTRIHTTTHLLREWEGI